MSDCGRWALVLIAFVGSVFSPYYAARRRRLGDAGVLPDAHCALNVSLHRRQGSGWQRWWAMTERGRAERSAGLLAIGPSRLAWSGGDPGPGELLVSLDERCSPWPRRLRGQLHLRPGALPGRAFALDAGGHHHWQPISPRARLQAEFDAPDCRWRGDAYLDANWGERPLARDFAAWQWQRAAAADGGAHLRYSAQGLDGHERHLGLRLHADGHLQTEALQPPLALPRSRWGLGRDALRGPALRCEALEDGPFYCRSLLQDEAGDWAMHESLDLRRFERLWVQSLLPFRMPRRA